MKPEPLTADELGMIRSVLRRHPGIGSAILFGSRAKGTHTLRSDVDLALTGDLAFDRMANVVEDLDELPLPHHFDVLAREQITYPPLREHIERVGIVIYPE